MRRVLKWAGFILAGVLGIVIIAIAVVYLISSSRMNKTYAINVDPVEPVADSAVIARGRHVAVIRGCVDCHGDGLEGRPTSQPEPAGWQRSTPMPTGCGPSAMG